MDKISLRGFFVTTQLLIKHKLVGRLSPYRISCVVLFWYTVGMQDLKWFQDRIGKKVFRKPNNPPCGCNTCNDIEKNGLEITDKDHADYMYEVQCEFYAGGHDVEYQDTPHI